MSRGLLGDRRLVRGHRGHRLAHEHHPVDREARVGAPSAPSSSDAGCRLAVSTARTPGSALAALVSIETILAWACGLRSSLGVQQALAWMSATYCTRP